MHANRKMLIILKSENEISQERNNKSNEYKWFIKDREEMEEEMWDKWN